MRVLQILSQIEITGAEAYAVTLADWLIANNCDVTLVSNKIHLPTKASWIPLKVHQPSLWTHLKNIFFLRSYIKKQRIQIVHCHSRAAVRLGFWATLGLRVAMVSTIHGRQHYSFSKRLFNLYGQRLIAVCDYLAYSLQKDFKISPRHILTVGNPVSLPQNPPLQTSGPVTVALVSRASGPKGQIARQLIRESFLPLLQAYPNLHIHVIGDFNSENAAETLRALADIQGQTQGRLQLMGYVRPLSDFYPRYQLVIGAGRVCIESLGHGVACYAIGEHKSEGLVTTLNYEAAKKSNFGDIGLQARPEVFDFQKITAELQKVLNNLPLAAEREILQQKIYDDFALENVCGQILQIYRSAYFQKWHPGHIPVLMYHKVPDQELASKHRIFLTKENFERHLRYFQKNNFTTLSFAELQEYRTLAKDPRSFPRKPLILTFDDGYVDNLENAGPLLKKYGMKATIFLLADPSVRHNYWDSDHGEPEHPILSLDGKRELLKYNFEIGSHGFRHEKINQMTETQAFHELQASKEALEKQFQVRIPVYAFTYGVTTAVAAKLAQKAGYDFAVNTDTGGLHLEENPYAIFRTPIFPEDKEPQLRKKTARWYRRYFYLKRGR